ncbi:hypothetical protein Peur_067571 [Populus x canadensis]
MTESVPPRSDHLHDRIRTCRRSTLNRSPRSGALYRFSFKDWLFPLHTPKVHFYWLEPLLVLAASRRINFGNICNNIWILETSLSTGRQSFGITGLTLLFTTANAACTAVMFWKGSKPVMSSQNYTHPPLVYRAYAESSLFESACRFPNNLSVVASNDPSTGTCKYRIMIQG